jgi:maltose alpha-D-glucosyltransferase/alpha-amylase
MHMIFNFWVNQYLFLALAREDATVLRRAYEALPPIPAVCQWANFLRTHDELDLGRLSTEEREEVYRAFAPEERMQLYGRGIRRRLAPMFGNDRKRLELAHSLLFTLPGTPVLRYGDEIGMGDDLTLEERNSVRTPMQWSDTANGGFSTVEAERLVLPVIAEGEYGYTRVNVATQQRDMASLLNWVEAAARVRRQCPEFGSGSYEWLETGERAALAHACHGEESMVFAVHNLSSRKVEASLALPGHVRGLHDLLSNRPERLEEGGRKRVELDAYGYRWFRAELSPDPAAAGRRTVTTP